MKLRIVGLSLLTAIMTLSILVVPMSAVAATAEHCNAESQTLLSFPTWYKYLSPEFVDEHQVTENNITTTIPAECTLNFSFPKDIGKVLLAVFEIILRLGGILAVIFVIYGGFQYIISQGEPDRIKNARTTILNALIGLVIAISATVIVNLIGRSIILS